MAATRERSIITKFDINANFFHSDGSTRTLQGNSYSNGTGMTDEACIAYCQSGGYFWAGTEYSSQCFCGNALDGGGALAANQGDCDMACSGMKPFICCSCSDLT